MRPIAESFFSPVTVPRNRSKDISRYAYFQGSISRGLWRFTTYHFTRRSAWLIAVTILFSGYAVNTLEIQAYTPFAYLVFIWLVAFAGSFLSRPRAALTASHSDRVRVGETLTIELEITQQHRWRQELTVVPHLLPPALDPQPEDGLTLPPLKQGESARASLGLVCRSRGRHLWHGFRVETDFPFGLFRAYSVISGAHGVLVTPSFNPITAVRVPSGRRYQPGGVAMASSLGDSSEFIGNREYREGDNLRDMDWRATARLNRPIVREYREEYFLRVAVVLDTYLPKGSSAADRENFERAISVAASISDCMARSDYIVELFAAGPELYRLTAGRSLGYIDRILEILACVEGNVEEPFDALEPEIMQSLAQITSVVCVFLDWNTRRRQFVDELVSQGAGLRVVVVRDAPCSLDPYDTALPGGVSVITKDGFRSGFDEI